MASFLQANSLAVVAFLSLAIGAVAMACLYEWGLFSPPASKRRARSREADSPAGGKNCQLKKLRKELKDARERGEKAGEDLIAQQKENRRLQNELEVAKAAGAAAEKQRTAAEKAEQMVRALERERDALRENVEKTQSQVKALESRCRGLEADSERLRKTSSATTEADASIRSIELAARKWSGVTESLDRLFESGKTPWYSNSFRQALLCAFASVSLSVESGENEIAIAGSPDEVLLRVDALFFQQLRGDDGLSALESARKLYFGRFNELLARRYEIRWPRRGDTFDESYCRLDRDNGFTEVRVAVSAAVFEDGELKRRARVETVPRT